MVPFIVLIVLFGLFYLVGSVWLPTQLKLADISAPCLGRYVPFNCFRPLGTTSPGRYCDGPSGSSQT